MSPLIDEPLLDALARYQLASSTRVRPRPWSEPQIAAAQQALSCRFTPSHLAMLRQLGSLELEHGALLLPAFEDFSALYRSLYALIDAQRHSPFARPELGLSAIPIAALESDFAIYLGNFRDDLLESPLLTWWHDDLSLTERDVRDFAQLATPAPPSPSPPTPEDRWLEGALTTRVRALLDEPETSQRQKLERFPALTHAMNPSPEDLLCALSLLQRAITSPRLTSQLDTLRHLTLTSARIDPATPLPRPPKPAKVTPPPFRFGTCQDWFSSQIDRLIARL